MSQTKAQLIQPIGVVTASGVVVSGVMTAATFDGDIVGSATSIIQGTNLNVGAFNATSFAGDFTGNATGIITSSDIKVGQLTASSFVGDFTGTATSMARGTGFEAGTVTSTAANVTYTVTVGSKTGGGNAFYLDGVEAPNPTLYPGATYTFDQSAGTNATHPLRFATAADAAGSTEYTDGVTTNGTPGSASAWTKIVVPRNAPTPLYYYCTNHSGMGDSISITNKLQGAVTGDVTGSATGIAGTVVQGTNIHVGVVTATSLYGDGSNLTGIAATNYNTQTVAAIGAATTIDLSAGNMITFNQNATTTVSLANTSEAMDVTLMRPGGDHSVAISFATGAVTIGGDDDYISIPASSDYDIGTGDFTIECWMYADSLVTSSHSKRLFAMGPSNADGLAIRIPATGNVQVAVDNTSVVTSGNGGVTTGEWTHVALCRKSSVMTLYINGKIPTSGTATATVGTDIDKQSGTFQIGANHDSPSTSSWNGEISNFRYVKGTAVYTEAFLPPTEALTNITNTKLLCCQSTSSATAAAVTPGTLTVNGTVTAAAATVSLAAASYATKGTITWPSSLQWNGGSAPTLVTDDSTKQQFQLLTRDSGVTWYGWEPYNNEANNWSLFAWGWNQAGGLGLNNKTSYSSPTQIPGTTWSQLSTSVAGGVNSILKSDGTMWTMGNSANGRLGLNQGPGNHRSSPTQVSGTTWSSVVCGTDYQIATKSNNTLWAWGQGHNGQLGQNAGTDISSPTQIGSDTTWATGKYKLSGGVVSVGAIKTNGTLWSWGYNNNGTLGDNTVIRRSSPVQVGTETNWRSIGGQYYSGMMLGTKTDGTLWTWGKNAEGNLGLNDTTNRSSPTQVPGTTWSEVTPYGGWLTACVIKTDGTLWAWGNNDKGGLGQNSTNDGYSSPVQIPGTTWKQCNMGDNGAAVASKTDGTLWSWGINQAGGLGLNQAHEAQLSSPTQIGTSTDWHSVHLNHINAFALKYN
tara:strand:- start:283 stop:3198 length:2916 start_codon:yes stop_codon:yes gene_type:complete